MKVVNAAKNCGKFGTAQVTTASNFLLSLGAGRAGVLERAGLNVESRGGKESAECESADTCAQNGFVLVLLGEGRWNER